LAFGLGFCVAGLPLADAATNPASKQLHFDTVLKQALESSYDIKIAAVNRKISETGIREIRSEYFPQLQARYNNEYNRNLGDALPGIQSVGNNTFLSNTIYQNALSLNANYKLFDMGVRRQKIAWARKDAQAKELDRIQKERDLKVKIVQIYSDVLLTYRELKAKEAMLPLAQELFDITQKLFVAGVVSKLDVSENAMQVAQTSLDIQNLKSKLSEHLHDLSLYTHTPYDIATLNIGDFDEPAVLPSEVAEEIDFTRTPEYRLMALEIEKKQHELKALSRQRFPVVTVYGNYNWYGSDPDGVGGALKNLDARSFGIGVAINATLFDGFKYAAQRDKLRLELEKLVLERDKQVDEEQNSIQKSVQASIATRHEQEGREDILIQSEEKVQMVKRLIQSGMTDQASLLQQRLQTLTRQLDVEQASIKRIAALYRYQFMVEALN
jgi:outer membrane protein TolC